MTEIISDGGPWLTPQAQLTLYPGEVHIWRASLDLPPSQFRSLARTLSADELYRAGKLYFEQGRQRFIAGRGQLRTILGHYTGQPASNLKFAYGRYGKPVLAGPEGAYLKFNLSHSDGQALYAITLDCELGVDIERVRPVQDVTQIVERFFSAAEYQVFANLPTGQQLTAFFNSWTRKEAFLKATGEGLTRSLDECETTFLPGQPARLLSVAGNASLAANWSLYALQTGTGFVAALAIQDRVDRLRFWEAGAVEAGQPHEKPGLVPVLSA